MEIVVCISRNHFQNSANYIENVMTCVIPRFAIALGPKPIIHSTSKLKSRSTEKHEVSDPKATRFKFSRFFLWSLVIIFQMECFYCFLSNIYVLWIITSCFSVQQDFTNDEKRLERANKFGWFWKVWVPTTHSHFISMFVLNFGKLTILEKL